MNRIKALAMLLEGRQAHLQWRIHARALIEGGVLDDAKAPVDASCCDFAKWYEGDAKACLGFLGHYQLVAESHSVMHAMYGEIHEQVRRGDFDGARNKMPDLVKASDALLDAIELLEQEISEAPVCPY